MRVCPLCGTPSEGGDRYCRSCGAVLYTTTAEKKKKGGAGSFILGMVIGFLLALVIGFFAITSLFRYAMKEGFEAFFDDFGYSQQYGDDEDDWLFGDDFGQGGQSGQTKPLPGDDDKDYQGGKDWLFGDE